MDAIVGSKVRREIDFRTRIACRNSLGKFPDRVGGGYAWFGENAVYFDRNQDAFYLALSCSKCGRTVTMDEFQVNSLDELDALTTSQNFRHACVESS